LQGIRSAQNQELKQLKIALVEHDQRSAKIRTDNIELKAAVQDLQDQLQKSMRVQA
jgi:hypothetical protein